MSVEEIKYAIENRIGLPPDMVDSASLREAGCQERVFLLPEPFNERARYMANVLVQMLGTGSPVKGELRAVSGVLCQALSYLVNSTSWREGKIYDFDLQEVKRKVQRLGAPEKDLCRADVTSDEHSNDIRGKRDA